ATLWTATSVSVDGAEVARDRFGGGIERVTGILHGARKLRLRHGAVHVDDRLADRDVADGHAGHRRQTFGDGGHAVAAGHAGDRERDGVCVHAGMVYP